jgi:hypothetical protein
MTLTAETDEPTYTPLYLGMNSEDAVCQRHSMTVHCDRRAAELGISGSDSFGDPMQCDDRLRPRETPPLRR